jgi:hypothetical protein
MLRVNDQFSRGWYRPHLGERKESAHTEVL